jgi:hypothetical protein
VPISFELAGPTSSCWAAVHILTRALPLLLLLPQACIYNREFKPAELQERLNRQLELDAYEAGLDEEEGAEEVGEEEEY